MRFGGNDTTSAGMPPDRSSRVRSEVLRTDRIKAGEIHGFKCTEAPLIQVDIHLSPTFIQENL